MSAPLPPDDPKPDPVQAAEGFRKFVLVIAQTMIASVSSIGVVPAEQLRKVAIGGDVTAELYDAIMSKLLADGVMGQCGDMLFVVTADGNKPVDLKGLLQ